MAMKDDIAIIREQQIGMAKDISYIKKALDGNGEPGLIKDTRANTDHRVAAEAKEKLTKFAIGSGWLIAVVAIGLQLLGLL